MYGRGEYHLVDSKSTEDVLFDEIGTTSASSRGRRYAWLWIISSYLLGALSLFLLTQGYKWVRSPFDQSITEGMEYEDLAKPNMTISFDKFDGRYDWVNTTADPYWLNFQKHFGIVKVSNEWARERNLLHTAAHPYEPEYGVYQIDGFHAIHCLDHLRGKIIGSNDTATPMALSYHVAHCIDFLRQYLMCHVDLSMHASPRDLFFTIDPPHQCQDFDAIHQWAERHAWADFRSYFEEHGPKPDEV